MYAAGGYLRALLPEEAPLGKPCKRSATDTATASGGQAARLIGSVLRKEKEGVDTSEAHAEGDQIRESRQDCVLCLSGVHVPVYVGCSV